MLRCNCNAKVLDLPSDCDFSINTEVCNGAAFITVSGIDPSYTGTVYSSEEGYSEVLKIKEGSRSIVQLKPSWTYAYLIVWNEDGSCFASEIINVDFDKKEQVIEVIPQGGCISIDSVLSKLNCTEVLDSEACYDILNQEGGITFNYTNGEVCENENGWISFAVSKDGIVLTEFTFEAVVFDPDIDDDEILNGEDPDADGDGVPNGMDHDIDGDGIANPFDEDDDGDGILDVNDPSPDGTDTEDCTNPGDQDGDGREDCYEPECASANPIVIEVSIDQQAICGDAIGEISVVLSSGHNLSDYNICFGDQCIDPIMGSISGLEAGSYSLHITDQNGECTYYQLSTEICYNGKDDDGDGLVDCKDLGCLLNRENNLKGKDPQKFDDICFDLSAALIAEIEKLLENTSLVDPCNFESSEDAIIYNSLSRCGNNCSINEFYDKLNEDEIILLDQSFSDCPIAQCIYDKLLESQNPYICSTIGEIYESDNFLLNITVSNEDHEGNPMHDPGYTFYDSETNESVMILNLGCERGDPRFDSREEIDIARLILHEMQHAIWIKEMLEAGLDPYAFESYAEFWPAYEDYLFSFYDNGGGLDGVQHLVMLHIENSIREIASGLQSLFGNDEIGVDYFMCEAALGLYQFMDPLYKSNFDNQYEHLCGTIDVRPYNGDNLGCR